MKYVEEKELQDFIASKMKSVIEKYATPEKMETKQMESQFRQNVEECLNDEAQGIKNKNIDQKVKPRVLQ